MSQCEDRRDALMDVALGAAAAPELEEHLRSCEACRAALDELRAAVCAVDAEVALTVAVTPPSKRPGGWIWAVAAVACALLVFFCWPRPQPIPDASALLSWKSPTASLLMSPTKSVLDGGNHVP